MAFIQYRKVNGRKYWSIVESRRINGKPRNIILEYLDHKYSLGFCLWKISYTWNAFKVHKDVYIWDNVR